MHRVIPQHWMPAPAKVHRIVLHWTAGRYTPSAFDRLHYHFLIDGQGRAIRGPRPPGTYLPHTRGLNTGSIGLAVCAMAGAVQGKRPYAYPVTRLQMERACQAVAELCDRYRLDITERTVLCHSEVERVYGIRQRGKWDIDAVEWSNETPSELHARFRRMVEWYADELK